MKRAVWQAVRTAPRGRAAASSAAPKQPQSDEEVKQQAEVGAADRESGAKEVMSVPDHIDAERAADLVFRDAVSSRLVFQQGRPAAVTTLPEPGYFRPSVRNHVVETTVDNIWQKWDDLERIRDDWEQMDLPRVTSRLTLELRWRVIQFRYRNDRYFQVSKLMEKRNKRKMATYRKAYRGCLQKLKAEGRGGWIPLVRCSDVQCAEVKHLGFLDFSWSRCARDWQGVLHEDSFRRAARQKNWSNNKDAGDNYWKHDWYYQTKWQRRKSALANIVRVQLFFLRFPFVFVLQRGTLVVLEHCSLAFDMTRARIWARIKRVQPLVRRTVLTEARLESLKRERGAADLPVVEKIYQNRRGSFILPFVLAVTILLLTTSARTYLMEGKLPAFLLPKREQEMVYGQQSEYAQARASPEANDVAVTPVRPYQKRLAEMREWLFGT
eukprot:TRINITY_DN9129_c0_g5_i1.p1 TRINITY_DN9129_c0_g5~~TRINITY_DN9129_c0_g5_i1.p1  ORF type:complete len:438 (+),score=112.47 TRINITY_DN9129_c0_g5_i1:122-1435(+)